MPPSSTETRSTTGYSTTIFPYDCVCYLTTVIAGITYQGSGVIIGSHTVLTASHMLWSQDANQAATAISIYPGYSAGSGTVISGTWADHYNQINDSGGLISAAASQSDFAVIDVSTDLSGYGAFGVETGYAGGTVHLTGYPASAGGRQTDQVGSVSLDPTYSLLDYGTVFASPGNSGGPLWVNLGTSSSPLPYVVGIVSTEGWATELTAADWSTIQGWEQSDTWLWSTTGSAASPSNLVLSHYGTIVDGWSSQDLYPRALGDVNGDSHDDIIGFGQDGVWVSQATGSGGFTQPVLALDDFGAGAGGWTSQNTYPRMLGDTNGDGKADIIGFGQDGVWESLATGSGSFTPPVLVLDNFGAGAGGWTSQDLDPRALGDVNGDGRDDIVGFGQDGVWVALANADGTFGTPYLALDNFGAGAGGWTSQNTDPRLLGDLTGNGRDDIVGFGQDGVWVSMANADGTFTQPELVLSGFAVDAGGWTSEDLYPRLLADVSGDGKADIVGFGQAGVWTALSNGDGTFATPTFDFSNFGTSAAAGGWTSDNTYPRLAGDVTGGRAAEIIGFGANGVWQTTLTGFT